MVSAWKFIHLVFHLCLCVWKVRVDWVAECMVVWRENNLRGNGRECEDGGVGMGVEGMEAGKEQ